MIPYTILGEGKDRILQLEAGASHRFSFKQIVDRAVLPVKFKRIGGQLYAAVSSQVLVFKKPHAFTFHKAYIQHNARAMWLGVMPEHDRLMEDMLEFMEKI